MFEIRTTDTGQLKRIAAAGGLAIIIGLMLIVFNTVGSLLGGELPGVGNVVFALFGVFIVLLATHPTYQAAEKLDDS